MTNNEYRTEILNFIMEKLNERGEDTARCATSKLNMPFVDEKGDDSWIEISVSIKKGSQDGEAYEGYAIREDYIFTTERKAKEKEERERKKAEKRKKDEERRAKTKADKEKAKTGS
jgi:hypothetical protein